jgi:molybdopterin-guanine dinucleotide biosynthesis protein A
LSIDAQGRERSTPPPAITGLVLAGGQGARMGGVDKGWQVFRGQALVVQVQQRLQQQTLGLQGLMISANRHLPDYAALGVPVWPDRLAGFAGPVAGWLSGLSHCPTPLMLSVPCDAPELPLDLAQRLYQALCEADADVAVATTPSADGPQLQTVFCLMKVDLQTSLSAFAEAGGRRLRDWLDQHRVARVCFDQAHDEPRAFAPLNTLADLDR